MLSSSDICANIDSGARGACCTCRGGSSLLGDLPPTAAAPGFAAVRVAKKGTTYAGTRCTEMRRQDQLQVCWSPMASGSCPTAGAGRWSASTPLMLQVRDPSPSPPGADLTVGLATCCMADLLKQNKEVQPNPEQRKIVPNKGRCPHRLFISL